MTQGVYNTSASVLWTKFARVFHQEIYDHYVELRKEKFTVENFMKFYYDNQISRVPEMDYNNSFYNKYLATEDRRAYLFMMHGRQYEYMYKWISERLYFLDTYFKFGEEYDAQCTVRVEYADFDKEDVEFEVQTYIPSYVSIVFKNTGESVEEDKYTVRKKVGRGQIVKFASKVDTATDQEIRIFNAPNIKDFGDISKYTPKSVLVGAAKKLTKLTVGTDKHPNPNLQELALKNNVYLTEIIADNCTAMRYSLDLTGCSNLEKFSAKGSTISSVEFPKGAPLKEIVLPAATTTIKLYDLAILDKLILETKSNEVSKLNKIDISNCPRLTGWKDPLTGEITEGSFCHDILNNYEPLNLLTNINMEVYGYVNNAIFLNSVTKLANKYPENFNIRGKIRYNGQTVPDMYSYFKSDFPDLQITYEFVNNVSSMFENYKNINAVWSRKEKHGTDDNIIITTEYYWTDLRLGEFPPEAYYTYEDKPGRKLDFYDEKDMKLLADEIKERLSPFVRFNNITGMFRGMRCLEYIHDDTFDHIDLSSADASYAFDGCSTLKYIEIPKTLRKLGSYMFANCMNLVVYIPESIYDIDPTAFYTNTHDVGAHPLLLFEQDIDLTGKPGVRDWRSGITRNPETKRAINHELTQIGNTNVNISYFNKGNMKIIYSIENADPDETLIQERFLNLDVPVDANSDFDPIKIENPFSNPLNVYEFLGGSLQHFNNLYSAAIPSFNLPLDDRTNPERLQESECHIARLFKGGNGYILNRDKSNFSMQYLFILPNYKEQYSVFNSRSKVNRFFLKDTQVHNVYVSPNIETIEESAFENCGASKIEVYGAELYPPKLTRIEYEAFRNSGIKQVLIPDTVTDIGDFAFSYCKYITKIKYSNGMTKIPEGCFRSCCESVNIVTDIDGFSNKITEIGNGAFADSYNLRLFLDVPTDDQTENSTEYDCYFKCDKTHSKNINYFTNLEYIGNYAFKGIYGISRLDISNSITYIGKNAFIPDLSRIDPDKPTSNSTLINWLDEDYSGLTIEEGAFINRELNWLCNKPGLKGKILPRICYIPNTHKIGNDAFSPYTSEFDNTGSKLDFILIGEENDDIDYKSIARNHLETITNFYDIIISEDRNIEGTSRSRLLYFLVQDGLNKKALVARLMPLSNGIQSTTVFIPANIPYQGNQYKVTDILTKSLTYNDTNLNNLYFDQFCKLKRIGDSCFTNASLYDIAVIKEDGNKVYNDDGTVLFIPRTVLISDENQNPIGKDIPFKQTSWYKNNTGISNDYIYLNEYCLGYDSQASLALDNKVMKDSIKVIYENAFYNELISSFTFPSELIHICKNAFNRCISLRQINFPNKLRTIDNNAFESCSSLFVLEYTPSITHIGTGAFSGCSNINTIIFPDGMVLDEDSDPLTPSLNEKGVNTTIDKLVISSSVGPIFNTDIGKEYWDFCSLVNLSKLTLSTITKTIELPQITEDGPYKKLYNSDWVEPHYALDFSLPALASKYPEARYADEPILISTTNREFICPKGDYDSNIDLAYIETDYEDSDILRLLLGLSKTTVNNITLSSVLASRMNAAIFSNIRLIRPVSFTIKNIDKRE